MIMSIVNVVVEESLHSEESADSVHVRMTERVRKEAKRLLAHSSSSQFTVTQQHDSVV